MWGLFLKQLCELGPQHVGPYLGQIVVSLSPFAYTASDLTTAPRAMTADFPMDIENDSETQQAEGKDTRVVLDNKTNSNRNLENKGADEKHSSAQALSAAVCTLLTDLLVPQKHALAEWFEDIPLLPDVPALAGTGTSVLCFRGCFSFIERDGEGRLPGGLLIHLLLFCCVCLLNLVLFSFATYSLFLT